MLETIWEAYSGYNADLRTNGEAYWILSIDTNWDGGSFSASTHISKKEARKLAESIIKSLDDNP